MKGECAKCSAAWICLNSGEFSYGYFRFDTAHPIRAPTTPPLCHRAFPEWRSASWRSWASRRANVFHAVETRRHHPAGFLRRAHPNAAPSRSRRSRSRFDRADVYATPSAPGSNVTLAPTTRAGAGASNNGSIRTVPANQSAGPLAEAFEPQRLISIAQPLTALLGTRFERRRAVEQHLRSSDPSDPSTFNLLMVPASVVAVEAPGHNLPGTRSLTSSSPTKRNPAPAASRSSASMGPKSPKGTSPKRRRICSLRTKGRMWVLMAKRMFRRTINRATTNSPGKISKVTIATK